MRDSDDAKRDSDCAKRDSDGATRDSDGAGSKQAAEGETGSGGRNRQQQGWQVRWGSLTSAPQPAIPVEISAPQPATPCDPAQVTTP